MSDTDTSIKKCRKRGKPEFDTNVLKLEESKKKVKLCFDYKNKEDKSPCTLKDEDGSVCLETISVRFNNLNFFY